MSNRSYSSVVPLPMHVSVMRGNEPSVLMTTSQYHSSLGGVRNILVDNCAQEHESLKILNLMQKAKRVIEEADSFVFNRVNEEFVKRAELEIGEIRDEIERLRKSDELRSDGAKIAADRLFTTVNTIKSFLSNCFVKNFI